MTANAVFAADAVRGQQIFATCAACHSDNAGGIGPPLKGVVGRNSAAVESYRYSGPMRRANLVWDESNLRLFLIDPQAKVPGNRMPFGGLSEQRDIDDVIAYLKTQK